MSGFHVGSGLTTWTNDAGETRPVNDWLNVIKAAGWTPSQESMERTKRLVDYVRRIYNDGKDLPAPHTIRKRDIDRGRNFMRHTSMHGMNSPEDFAALAMLVRMMERTPDEFRALSSAADDESARRAAALASGATYEAISAQEAMERQIADAAFRIAQEQRMNALDNQIYAEQNFQDQLKSGRTGQREGINPWLGALLVGGAIFAGYQIFKEDDNGGIF